jgi:hypothetical protein
MGAGIMLMACLCSCLSTTCFMYGWMAVCLALRVWGYCVILPADELLPVDELLADDVFLACSNSTRIRTLRSYHVRGSFSTRSRLLSPQCRVRFTSILQQ